MKLIEKFMLKRCSTEVQVMLTRMRERPEDFDYGSGWRKLVEIAKDNSAPYTKIERRMIRAYWKQCQLQQDRKALLAQIMKQTINPTSREDLEDGEMMMSATQSRLYAQAQQAGFANIGQHLLKGTAQYESANPYGVIR
jgi:hypothetical protein